MTQPSRSTAGGPRRAWPAWLRRSRGTAPRTGPVPRVDHGSWTVDRGVRALATACEAEDRGIPAVHAVVVGPDTLLFQLSTPDERPPAGWTAEHNGRSWHAPLRLLQSAPVAESTEEPYPRLVSLGRTSKGFVLLNLGQAGGIIGLEGDARQARALAQDWARELTTSPWSREGQVVRVGFKPGAADPTGTTEAKSLVDAEAALADDRGGVLLLAGLPGGRDRERVYRLADEPGSQWTVVVVGRVEHPKWRLTLDSAGVVDTGLMDEPVAHRQDALLDEWPVEDPAEDPAAEPVAGKTPASRGPRSLFTPLRLVVAGVLIACVALAAVLLTPKGSSLSSADAAHASDNPTASADPSSANPSVSSSVAPSSGAPSSGAAGLPLVHPVGNCLSGTAGTDGTPLKLEPCGSDPNQRWVVGSDGTLRTNGLCMDATWGGVTPGTVVQIANCSGNPAQQFTLRSDHTIYSVQSKLCVNEANNGAQIALLACSHSASEVFNHG